MFSASGAGAAVVDIALDGGGTGTVVGDLGGLGEAFDAPPAAPEPAPTQAPAAAPAVDNSLDFSLPDLEPEPTPAPAPAPAAAPAASPDGALEFNVGDLNYDKTMAIKKKDEPKKAAPPVDEPTVATDFGTDSQVEFDKALTDLASFVNTNVPAQPEAAAAPSIEGLSMDAPAAPAGGDEATGTTSSISEVGTKLDLARAYIDMGDPDGAKSILEEVMLEGNAQQKQEAQELLKHASA
jgi:pilus assembly protein FimV